MPFVRIDALRADQAKLDGLGRAVHDALVEAIGIPADDLFQVLTSHDGTTGMFRYDPDYLGVHRDDGIVYIDITMRAGRTRRAEEGAVRQDRRTGRQVRRDRAEERVRHHPREPVRRLVVRRGRGPVPGA